MKAVLFKLEKETSIELWGCILQLNSNKAQSVRESSLETERQRTGTGKELKR